MNKIDETFQEKRKASWSRSTKKEQYSNKKQALSKMKSKEKKEKIKKEHDRSLIGIRKRKMIGQWSEWEKTSIDQNREAKLEIRERKNQKTENKSKSKN